MRYFDSRQQAGKLLGNKMTELARENTTIIALGDGAIVVSLEIARILHSSLYSLATQDITLPGEHDPLATLTSSGTYTTNSGLSLGELESINADNRSVIDEQRINAFHKLNRLDKTETEIPKKLLKNHTVIFVSDGLKNGLSLDVASDFIKSIKTKKIVVATPIASIVAVDKMHLFADMIYNLGVVEGYMDTDHYYRKSSLPSHEKIIETMKNITMDW